MKYKCLIADDQLIERDTIEMDLLKTGRFEIVASCADGLEVLKVLGEQDVDVVFSDIDMPNLDGLGVLKSLRHAPVFVFITSHEEHAVESYELDVVDFIVKPFSFERLLRAANKAIEYIELKRSAAERKPAPAEGNDLQPAGNEDHFFIRENHDLVKLKYEEVAYIESMGHFSRIYTLGDRKHTTLVGLKNLEQVLPSSIFSRVHKQYLVNHHHISVIGQGEVTLDNRYQVPVGLSYRQALLDQVVSNKAITRFSE